MRRLAAVVLISMTTALTATVLASPAVAAPAGYSITGIDVSHYQTSINWASVAGAGAKFAYAKATEGVSIVDATFSANYNGAKGSGLLAGAYHYARPDQSGGRTQADYFLDRAQWANDGRTLPAMLDIEWPAAGSSSPSPCYGLSTSQMVTWIRDFVTRVKERTGRPTMIYTNTNWWNPCTGSNGSFGDNPLFIANYSGSPTPLPAGWSKWTLWQYSSSGSLPGDQDVFNGSYAELATLAGGGNLGVLDFTLSDSLSSSANTRPVVSYGNSPMVPIAGDWDGNGTVTPSAYDPTTGKFYISNTPETGAATWVFAYGNPYAVPVVGDWDGDGKDNVGVRMGSTFYLRTSPVTSGTETTSSVSYGDSADAPVVGDWDGDGKDNVGVYRPALAKFFLRMTANSDPAETTQSVTYGNAYALPLVGDWNGDHRDNVGVRMGLTDYLRTSEVTNATETTQSVAYGNGFNEWPIIGDWNGDGIDTQGMVF
jgi:GH25 family lysozyme M1 (1,4-beta-N-acetylmuramidase)